MPRPIRRAPAILLAALLAPTWALADTGQGDTPPAPRADQPPKSQWISNWPAAPDRQGGREYTKFTRPELGGPVERNFESGRN
ncbi:hypothetical protein LCL97_13620 [Seohaeicola saemankumensis]|nr:hypothetical protein [Seohaeicola saemankumensis]MCA0871872.1 hypothetical protein [Seohaeicola saemankumensis]